MRLIFQLIKGNQESKNNLNIAMEPLYQHFLPLFSVLPITFCLNLNEAPLPRISSITPAFVKGDSSLWYCYELPDVFK